MSAIVDALIAELDDEALDRLAALLAPRLTERLGQNAAFDQWLNTEEAARHIASSRGRLYDLVQLRKLEPRRDGRRLLFKRSDLDAYLEAAT